MRAITLLTLSAFMILSGLLKAQRGPHPGHRGRGDHYRGHHPKNSYHYKHHKHDVRHHKHAWHRHSIYRPHRAMVFRPYWAPHHRFYRRWVYFPGLNLYWDNWRNHYVFFDGYIWISRPHPPHKYKDHDLQKEKRQELNEREDDTDDIYRENESHRKRTQSPDTAAGEA